MTDVLILSMPQWQGGDIAGYHAGGLELRRIARDLAGLQVRDLPVAPPPLHADGLLGSDTQDGISSRSRVVAQLGAALTALTAAAPERTLMLGGDCATSLAPIAHHVASDEELGLVWIDAHPDMWDGAYQPHANAMAAAAVTGTDTTGLHYRLPATVDLNRVVWVGTRAELLPDTLEIDHIWRNRVAATLAIEGPAAVVRRLQRKRISRIAIHIDLDVLDATEFTDVAVPENGVGLTWVGLTNLVRALAEEFEVVHGTVAECVVSADSGLSEAAIAAIAQLIRDLHAYLGRKPVASRRD
ncbi:arginase family protein [Microbacterium aurantiacum]|uniref:Arginase family protein n=1 Tax=Microbacterium aurantiacum TaxID=162393 RepID=A0AAJ2HLX3_9MICO|nr:arginase family protein [Microbacterium aurantiacum]MDS0246980.1 arginase family protein [Microbacterium aurantiacum]